MSFSDDQLSNLNVITDDDHTAAGAATLTRHFDDISLADVSPSDRKHVLQMTLVFPNLISYLMLPSW